MADWIENVSETSPKSEPLKVGVKADAKPEEAAKLIELTEAHKKHYPEWKDRYIAVQLSTDGTDRQEVENRLRDLYRRADLSVPARIVFAPSPVAAAVVGCFAKKAIDTVAEGNHSKGVIISSMLEATEKVSEHIHGYFNKIVDGLDDQIDPTHQPAPSKLNANISELVMKASGLSRSTKVDKPDSELTKSFEESLKNFQSAWNGGNTWAYSHAHLTFFRDIMGATLPLAENFANYEWLNENSGPRMMYEEFVVVSSRPLVLNTRVVNNVYQMHAPSGSSSVCWEDGISLFHSNNVQLPPWMMKSRPSDLDPRLFSRMTNVSVRAEFCRMVGMERILKTNNARVIDSEPDNPSKYTLLELTVGEERFRYLSMLNQSVDMEHVEGVEMRCETVQQALNFRNGFRDDQIDDLNGVEWSQHGDVVVFPKGATKFRSRPTRLS